MNGMWILIGTTLGVLAVALAAARRAVSVMNGMWILIGTTLGVLAVACLIIAGFQVLR
jgi:hypothetical protein